MPPWGTNYAKWPAEGSGKWLVTKDLCLEAVFLWRVLWEDKCQRNKIVFQPFKHFFVLLKLLYGSTKKIEVTLTFKTTR
jgi:hypothetical protein